MIRYLKYIFVISILVTCFNYQNLHSSEQKRILVIHSYHPGLAWTRGVIEGIEEAFQKQYPDAIIQNEFMDTKRFNSKTVFPSFKNLLLHKIKKAKPDVIIVSDDNALNFVFTYYNSLFRDLPIVFCGINDYNPNLLKPYKNITGVVEYFDVGKTLNVALKLHQNTRTVYVINDTTTTGRKNRSALLKILPRFSKNVFFEFLQSYSMEEIQAILASPAPNSIILLMSFTQDNTGKVFTYRESIRKISESTKLPIYGVWDFYLGYGLVGGKILRGSDQGEDAARMAIRILKGASPEKMPVILSGTSQYIFDHRELKRFNIDLSLLPVKSSIRFTPKGFYEKYKTYIWLISLVAITLLSLTLVLFFQVAQKRHVEKTLRDREERLKLIIHGAELGTWDWNIITGEASFNKRWSEMLGFKPKEIQLKVSFWEQHIHPEDLPDVEEKIDQHLRGDSSMYESEHRLQTKDGNWIWVLARGKTIQWDHTGRPVRMTGTHLDITDRKLATDRLMTSHLELERTNEHLQATMEELEATNEEFETQNNELVEVMSELEKHRALLDSIFNAVPAGIGIVELGTISWSNPMLSTMTGYGSSELKRMDLHTIFPAYNQITESANNATLHENSTLETQLLHKDGKQREVLVNINVIEYLESEVGFTIVVLDITERKKSEELTFEQQKFQEALLFAMPLPVFYKDMDGRYLGCNKAFENFFGMSCDDLVGKTAPEIWEKGDADLYVESDRKLFDENQQFQIYETKLTDGQERLREVVFFKTIFSDMGNKPAGIVGTFLDITERKDAQNQAEHLRQYLKSIIDSMPAIIIGVDMDCQITQWNRRAELHWEMTADEAQIQGLQSLLSEFPVHYENIQEAIHNKEVFDELKTHLMKENKITFWDISVYPLVEKGYEGAVIRIDDVTERVRLEELMIQAEKMFSIGGLAAGMAHEINNPLAGILQNVQVIRNRISKGISRNKQVAIDSGITIEALERYAQERDIFSMIEAIEESGNRAARIVRNMLNFSRKSEADITHHNLMSLMDETIELAENEYDLKKQYDFRKIYIIRDYEENHLLENVVCEGSKIQQVFLNVLKNGAQAMAEVKEPEFQPEFKITLAIEENMARIEVLDNGPGMDEDVRKRIFEPFFTTKSVGQGTGLGLSLSYFIVTENHSGTMQVDSAPGKGTRFIIKLPLGA